MLFSEDTRKIQAENKDKINKKELERMQREKTAQNGNVFARQHEEMDKQLDKEVGYFIFEKILFCQAIRHNFFSF